MTPAKRSLFTLAENLGLMVCDIKERMPLSEFADWLKYYQEIDEPEENTTDKELMEAFKIAG